jgi:transcriptional regulatory protein RtcR
MILRAIEEKRFLPLGSDIELQSDFQLIAGTNRDLYAAVRKGEFREDLLARLGIWSYVMLGLWLGHRTFHHLRCAIFPLGNTDH